MLLALGSATSRVSADAAGAATAPRIRAAASAAEGRRLMPIQRAGHPRGCAVHYGPARRPTTKGLTMAKRPHPGDQAPDFELEGTDGRFRLADHRGRRVVLLFYPGDNTPVCTRQFCSYRDHADDLGDLDAVIVGISAQDLDSHAAFVAKHGLNVPLLADADGAVAKLYGAHAPVVGTRRAVIVIDEDGCVRARHDHRIGIDFQDVEDLREMLGRVPART